MSQTVNNIGQLKALLQSLEDEWTTRDTAYLGHFEDQPIFIHGDIGAYRAAMTFDPTIGLVGFRMPQPDLSKLLEPVGNTFEETQRTHDLSP